MQIYKGELTEPLAWAVKHRSALKKDGSPSSLEFKLQRLLFLNTLQHHGVIVSIQRIPVLDFSVSLQPEN